MVFLSLEDFAGTSKLLLRPTCFAISKQSQQKSALAIALACAYPGLYHVEQLRLINKEGDSNTCNKEALHQSFWHSRRIGRFSCAITISAAEEPTDSKRFAA